MAAIRLKIERLQDRAQKHEARHAEMMSRSQEIRSPLSTQVKEKMVGAAKKTKGALQETADKAKVTLQGAGEVTKEKTSQLGEGVKGAGAKARGAVAGTPEEQETFITYERTGGTQGPTPPPPPAEGKGGEKIPEQMSSPLSQGIPRKGEGPKVEELKTPTEEP